MVREVQGRRKRGSEREKVKENWRKINNGLRLEKEVQEKARKGSNKGKRLRIRIRKGSKERRRVGTVSGS